MKARLRRLTVPAAFAVITLAVSPAPNAHAEEGSSALRGVWGALWAWLTPPALSAGALGPGAVWLEAGLMIDPFGGAAPPSPAAAPVGRTGDAGIADPNG